MNRPLPPRRRVILLGASNLVRSFSTVVETARQIWREPIEIMAAIGHGRSYGRETRVLGRKISGIFSCTLWEDLQRRAPLPTTALVTDIGNDFGYGVPVDTLLNWVQQCVDRLAATGATTVVTALPMESLESLSERRFRFYKRLFFPRSALTLSGVIEAATALNGELAKFAELEKTSVISASKSWYGLDPIHLKRAAWREAWPSILAPWHEAGAITVKPRTSLARWAYLYNLAPAEQSIFGVRRCCKQPSGVLRDGSTISLY